MDFCVTMSQWAHTKIAALIRKGRGAVENIYKHICVGTQINLTLSDSFCKDEILSCVTV